MSLTKFESGVKLIQQDVESAYERFADMSNLKNLQERFDDPAIKEQLAQRLPEDKMEEVRRQLDGMTFDRDSVSLTTPMGHLLLRIVEREAPKCIKFASEGAPLQLYLWIQLLPRTETTCAMRVTVGAEVNFFMKGMVSKPLQQAADGLADILSAIR